MYSLSTYNEEMHTRYVFTLYARHIPICLRMFQNKTFGTWLFDESADVFFDELVHWDGYRSAKNSIQYVTSNKQNADIIQAFAHITGRCALLKVKNRSAEHPNWSDAYVVDIWLTPKNCHEIRSKPKIMEFNGVVYCAETPTGYFMARRNGKVWVTGNSGRLVQVQNLPQNHLPDLEDARNLIKAGLFDAVGIESIKIKGYPTVATTVDFITVKDGLDCFVHNLGGCYAVGINEKVSFVCLVITLNIAIAEWQFNSSLIWLLAPELGDAFFNSSIYRHLDCLDGFRVGFRNKYRNAVSFFTAVYGYGFPTMEVAETGVNTGYDLGFARILVCHINQSSIISLNSFFAFETFKAGRLSVIGTRVGLPGGLYTRSPRTSLNLALPISFSNSVSVIRLCL
jgi:hypothetical protein